MNDDYEDVIDEDYLDFLLNQLSSRERFCLIHRFGLQGETAKTYKEIGVLVNVCLQTVRVIVHKALKRCRIYHLKETKKDLPIEYLLEVRKNNR